MTINYLDIVYVPENYDLLDKVWLPLFNEGDKDSTLNGFFLRTGDKLESPPDDFINQGSLINMVKEYCFGVSKDVV